MCKAEHIESVHTKKATKLIECEYGAFTGLDSNLALVLSEGGPVVEFTYPKLIAE